MYILSIIRNIYAVLNKEQKTKMLLLQIFFAFSAIVQVVGVASIAPFIGIISNPQSIQTSVALSTLYKLGNFQSNEAFITGFALLSIAMIFISNLMNALTLWLQLKFSIYLGFHFQQKLFDNFIRRDYLFHKSTNYNKLISIISADSPRFIYMVLQPYLLMCSQAFVALIIVGGLIFLDPTVALGSTVLIGGAYAATYWVIKKTLKHHGEVITSRSRAGQALLSEAFIGIKDIKLNTLENKYTDNYREISRAGLKSSAYIALSGDLPRFAIETISFSAILFFAVFLLRNTSDTTNVVSLLSVYALAGYKLLPTMQQIYKSVSSLSANGSIVDGLKFDLNEIAPEQPHIDVSPLTSVESINLENICYQYPNTTTLALDGVSLAFARGHLNTIAGPSGSGKSTLADVMLGLLKPAKGSLNVNAENTAEDERLFSYQRTIGYVPQHIFVLDDDVIANVAFGVEKEKINLDAVTKALIQANAMEFVSKLPHGMETNLGQDGKLLSGGQRQRIGIARALYRNNKVLILDEPTSALDIESEYELMQLLNALKKDILIVVISHRPAAIKLSDTISVIAGGKLVANGSYNDLLNTNNYFKSMIEKGFMEEH